MILRLTQASFGPVAFGLPITLFFILIIAGCAPLLSAVIGLVSCVGAHWLVQTGLEIDTTNRLQRTYYTVLGDVVGSWEPLPPIAGVTLKYFSTVTHNTTPSSKNSWGIWKDDHKRNEELIVMLSVAQSNTGITLQAFSIDRLQAAHDFGQSLASQFGVPLNIYLPPHLAAPR
ncbi:hypothetical protein HMJ29_17085 [Hymenobacter taeanensis]|uniref:Uncharacterized protein n=1 Tax=Hymenobacter taeanensis TaxID=2735321 RepID=A0A6M6BL12_9BACT|nr:MULTISPECIES: hypothetical protein [Hymenobacter]QJX48538.1 hypothetical protein HMJ29_17085 [Hymenobacter taeanensis]UOQ81965.1 hypothetical protein MUN83_04025 [Hymenobacter sp. 5414T-23]